MAGNKGNRQIKPVTDRTDKQRTYQEQMTRYRKAIRDGFFFEAIMIDYACLEDRLRYMLYYFGVLRDENDHKITDKGSRRISAFRGILRKYQGEKANLNISGIKGKRQITESIIRLASEPEKPDNPAYDCLWKALHDETHDTEILKLLQDIESWCGYRNEIVHSLLNKNLESLYEQLQEQAEKGYMLFRQLDCQVRWIKRQKLREKMKIKA